jgi:hypothetical protein
VDDSERGSSLKSIGWVNLDAEHPNSYLEDKSPDGLLKPIHIDDELGEYKIVMKLAVGWNSSVWLGKSTQ